MRTMRAMFRGRSLCPLACLLALGCGNGEGISTDFKKPESERIDLDDRALASGPIRIPETGEFNFTSYRSGQSGMGKGSVEPQGKSGFDSRAEARDGGSAWAEFHLGYTFDHAGSAAMSAIVRLRVKVSGTQKIERASVADTDPAHEVSTCSSQLHFFIKDSNGRVIKDENLLGGGPESGPSDIQQAHDLAFDLPLEQGVGYYLVLGGRVDAKSVTGGVAQVTLSVSEASLELKTRLDTADKSGMTAGAAQPAP